MRGIIGKFIKFFKSRHELHIKRNVITYGICLVIATILWFLNTLNKEYVTEITYPVKYVDLPKGKLLVDAPPNEMTLEIKALGFALLRYRIGTSFLPIVLNVKSLIEKKDLLDYTINLSDIKERISTQLNSDIKLLGIKPETITFHFSRFETKKVPVIPQVNYTLERQYMLKNNISVIPAHVEVSGPASILDTLKGIRTELLTLKNISKDFTKNVSFDEIYGIQIEATSAKIKIEIERFTESRKTIPVIVKNLPDSLLIRLFPHTIDITFDIGLSRYESVADTSFIFSVDYDQTNSNPSLLKIKVEKQPEYIRNLMCTPESIEYLIEKNK